MARPIHGATRSLKIEDSVSNGYPLRDVPKSKIFTSSLPADEQLPTPAVSHGTPRRELGPRLVKNALFSYVRPEPVLAPELIATSSAALQDLGISPEDAKTEEFREVLAGNKILTWNEDSPEEGIYPWAQCYGGYQFGQWAGQLGDGRAISLFEILNPATNRRYELQLKGAGRTPYSRFADGKAVLRSSLREFVVSEYLNSIGIPSTRALSLVLTPHAKVLRERIEPGAIVARFASTWIRLGTFDLLRARGDRQHTRQLAEYVAVEVYGGWERLPLAAASEHDMQRETRDAETANVSAAKDLIEGDGKNAQNRFARLYRAIVRANARTVAAWQAYGFMNGVLNTDNTSIAGLSLDFGPFAFMDTFDPTYTPNHDDSLLRYSFRAQPSAIWWNLVRLGEAFGELIGAGPWCDEESFIDTGVDQERMDELVGRAETIIEQAGQEYKDVFMAEYRRLMTARMGLKRYQESDFDELYSGLLDIMQEFELDFNHIFRRLSSVTTEELKDEQSRRSVVARIFVNKDALKSREDGTERLSTWLQKWTNRVQEDWKGLPQEDRLRDMKRVNPKFIPRGWILEELIDRVQNQEERQLLDNVMKMVLRPFDEEWGWDKSEEERFCGDVPKYKSSMQCSCSS